MPLGIFIHIILPSLIITILFKTSIIYASKYIHRHDFTNVNYYELCGKSQMKCNSIIYAQLAKVTLQQI
ncbi:MAG: hypothetical protein KatS3mg066_1125 [Fischerella sp.]|nr:MAG: hypothetical protein KatS3mg066_1125 [Fischerella sp.]